MLLIEDMVSTTRPQGAGKQMAKTPMLRCSLNSLISVLFAFVFAAVYLAGERRLWVFEDEEDQATTQRNSLAKCNLFSGKWVFDNKSYPLYKEKECTFMWDEFACEKFERKDLNYQSWRWQPHQCDLPRFNATALLEKLRGKRMVFVGDSLNRDQWVSMVCLVESAIPAALKSKQYSGNLVKFKAFEYNASIDFYWSPLLVESNSDDPARPRLSERIARISEIEKHARHWTNADILIFNSYMWWRWPKTKLLWGSFESSDNITKEVEMLQSYEMAIRTLSDWLNIHVDRNRTRSFFMSMSPTHLRGQEWGMSKPDNCYNETMPITKEGYWGSGSNMRMMKIVEAALDELRAKGLQIEMLNITQLSEYRKEAHPSIYNKQWRPLTEAQLSNPRSYSDCVHWCLPGVPDVWNEILYAYIVNLT